MIRCLIYFILFLSNQILIHSLGSFLAAIIFLFYLIFSKFRELVQKKNLNFFVLTSLIICFITVSVAYLYCHIKLIYDLLDPLTTIKESLYVRFILWSGIIELILKAPLFGFGLGDQAEFFLRPHTSLYYNAHNAYLQTLYEGGIVTMAAVLVTLYITSRKLKVANNQTLSGIFSIIIFCDIIMMLSAIPSWYTWYPVLLIAQIAVCTAALPEEQDESVK